MSYGAKANFSIKSLALTFGAIVSISHEISAEPNAIVSGTNVIPIEKKVGPVTDPSVRTSWRACIDTAKLDRSARDLEFFVRSSNLSNAKSWFISHSAANEQRFCSDVSICEKKFQRTYEAVGSDYPSC